MRTGTVCSFRVEKDVMWFFSHALVSFGWDEQTWRNKKTEFSEVSKRARKFKLNFNKHKPRRASMKRFQQLLPQLFDQPQKRQALPPVLRRDIPTDCTLKLAQQLQRLCMRLAAKDGISRGNWAVNGAIVRIFSQREIMLYLDDAQMHTMIQEMEAYLRA